MLHCLTSTVQPSDLLKAFELCPAISMQRELSSGNLLEVGAFRQEHHVQLPELTRGHRQLIEVILGIIPKDVDGLPQRLRRSAQLQSLSG